MRVLCVAPYFHPKPGGLERYAYEVCRRLAERHEIKVLCSNPSSQSFEVVSVGEGMKISNTPVSFRAAKVFPELSKWSDVVYSHTPVPYFADMAILLKKKPTVVVHHSAFVMAGGKLAPLVRIYRYLQPYIHSKAEFSVAVSEFVKRAVKADFVVEPGVDTDFFRPCSEKSDYLLFVGQLNRGHMWKGLDILIEAASHTGDRLVVVGDGNAREYYERLSREFSVKVEFTGAVSDLELVRLYSSAKLLVLPSKSELEAFGMVALEANACGTGVVGTRVGGIPYYIRDGKNGVLCNPSPRSLAEAIENAGEIYRKLGSIGRKIAERYTWDKTAEETEKILIKAANLA